jgi:hypothetical protein
MSQLEAFISESAGATRPVITERSKVSPGGVDPLGLRQLNFDLMDEVLPGLNNVARRLKPFLVMAWAWRRARQAVDREGGAVPDGDLRDFVDRIEAIYAWSQFLTDPNADIPGRQALAELMSAGTIEYEFGGASWERRRDLRRTSTGLISPLNYGPGLRSMGWLIPVGPPGIFRADDSLDSALDAFEEALGGAGKHPAFSQLGSVVVQKADVQQWGLQWELGSLAAIERHAGWLHLAGPTANVSRRKGLAFVKAVAESVDHEDVDLVRRLMAEPTSDGNEHREMGVAWRRLQLRQLFRLTLEGWFFWLMTALAGSPPKTTKMITAGFLEEAGASSSLRAADWLRLDADINPVPLIAQLEAALSGDSEMSIPQAICEGLRCCMREGERDPMPPKGLDRLPIRKAVDDFSTWQGLSAIDCASHMIERWILAQHSYWCVGRGLADARGQGKTILRLRVVMEEGGWTLTPGARIGGHPVPTPDRLSTALSLLRECGQLAGPAGSA